MTKTTAPVKNSAIARPSPPREHQEVDTPRSTSFIQLTLLLAATFLPACFTTNLGPSLNQKTAADFLNGGGTSGDETEDEDTSSGTSLLISTISLASSDDDTTFSLFFDNTRSTPVGSKITDFCAVSGGSNKSCACQFKWQEVNTTTGSSVPITRSVQTAISTLQSGLVTCSAPSKFSTEIENGTVISVSVVATGSNPEIGNFTVQTKQFTKTGSAQAGSFQDSQGRAFENVLRYSCHDRFSRGLHVVTKKTTPIQHPTESGNAVEILLGTSFCGLQAGATSAGTGCGLLPSTDFSAQAHYYNLYIRESQRGSIVSENQAFTCPRIKESLGSDGTIGTQGQFWPLDQSFALALSQSSDFSIGVASRVRLSNSASTDNSSVDCSGNAVGAGDGGDNSILTRCLGFAAKPTSDGTCPTLRDAAGRLINTLRLRRLIAIYPPIFDATGKLVVTQQTDQIYVLDRPVSSTTADPSKPFTMRGPKPCPFAYFDHKGVTSTADPEYPSDLFRQGGRPGYVSTGNSLWNGTNVDGTQFPNQDIANQSCSASFPVLNNSGDLFSMATIHHSNNPVLPRRYVRPIQSWFPHYEEDIAFQACAPQAQPVIDPPLHFAKDSTNGNVGWCAESYPTQNPYASKLDIKSGTSFPGKVKNYTSHVAKNSTSPTCTATQLEVATSTSDQDPYELPIPSIYPTPTSGSFGASTSGSSACLGTASTTHPTGVAYHPNTLIVDSAVSDSSTACKNNGSNLDGVGSTCSYCAHQTCDRTVVNPGLAWDRFPLQATPDQTEQAISSDSTYGCVITYDNNGPKTGRATPTGGCCGASVKMKSGSTTVISNDYLNAHLEPGQESTTCLTPTY
jgi:hypothetical protein